MSHLELRQPCEAGEDRNCSTASGSMCVAVAAPALRGWRGSQQPHRRSDHGTGAAGCASPASQGWLRQPCEADEDRNSNRASRTRLSMVSGCASSARLTRIATWAGRGVWRSRPARCASPARLARIATRTAREPRCRCRPLRQPCEAGEDPHPLSPVRCVSVYYTGGARPSEADAAVATRRRHAFPRRCQITSGPRGSVSRAFPRCSTSSRARWGRRYRRTLSSF